MPMRGEQRRGGGEGGSQGEGQCTAGGGEKAPPLNQQGFIQELLGLKGRGVGGIYVKCALAVLQEKREELPGSLASPT